MRRFRNLTFYSLSFGAGVLVSQTPLEVRDRLRALELWKESHDRDVPMSPRVYVEEIGALSKRMDRLEEARDEDIRRFIGYFLSGCAVIGAALVAGNIYFLRRVVEGKK